MSGTEAARADMSETHSVMHIKKHHSIFLLYQYNQTKFESLAESEEEFSAKMQKGFDDMKNGRVTPLDEAFSEIKRRFA